MLDGEDLPVETPPPEAPEDKPQMVVITSSEIVINEEELQQIPTGRTYQSVVTTVAGATAGKKGKEKTREEDTEDRSAGEHLSGGQGQAQTENLILPPMPAAPATPPKAAEPAYKAPAHSSTRAPASTATTPAPNKPAFAQQPTPLTLALPLSGEALYRQQALLDPGLYPQLTLTYRRGDP